MISDLRRALALEPFDVEPDEESARMSAISTLLALGSRQQVLAKCASAPTGMALVEVNARVWIRHLKITLGMPAFGAWRGRFTLDGDPPAEIGS